MAQTDIDEIIVQPPPLAANGSDIDEIVVSEPEIDEVMIAPPGPNPIEKMKSVGNAFLDAYRPVLQEQARRTADADPQNWSSARFKKESPPPRTIEEQAIFDATLAKKKVQEKQMAQQISPDAFQSEISAAPPDSAFKRLNPFSQSPEEKIAHAANVYAIHKETGIPLDKVESDYRSLVATPEITGIQKGVATIPEYATAVSTPLLAMGLAATPLKVLAGLGTFKAIDEIDNALASAIKKKPYVYGSGEKLASLLMQDANQVTKDVVEVLDVVGKGLLAGGITAKAPSLSEFLTKKTIQSYGLPQDVYISPGKIREIFGTTPPPEADIVKGLGLDGGQYRQALKDGMSIKVPAQKVTTITDRPYWAKVKQAIGLEPFKQVVTENGKISYEIGGVRQEVAPAGQVEPLALPEAAEVPEPLTKDQIKQARRERYQRECPELYAQAERIQKIAEEKQQTLNQIMKQVSDEIGVQSKDIPTGRGEIKQGQYLGKVKSIDSMVAKILRKRSDGVEDYSVSALKDHARGAMILDSAGQIPQVLALLKRRIPQIHIENFVETPLNFFGYRGVNSSLSLGNGINGEIQIHTPESWKLKLESDQIYTKWLDAISSNTPHESAAPAIRQVYEADIEKSKKMWESYWGNLPEDVRSAISESERGLASVKEAKVSEPASSQVPSGVSTRAMPPSRIGDVSTSRPSVNLPSTASPLKENLAQEQQHVKSSLFEKIPEDTTSEAGFVAPTLPPSRGENLYQKYVNRFQSLENISKEAKAKGAIVMPGVDPGLRARGYLGVGQKAQSMLESKTFQITPAGNIKTTGEGFKPILDEYDKLNPNPSKDDDLVDYLIANRIIKDLQRPRSETDPENIATPEQVAQSQKVMDELAKRYGSLDVFESTARRLYDYQSRVLRLLVDSGNISKEQFSNILSKNQNYVPFERILGEEEPAGGAPKAKNIFTGARSFIKRIKGSERPIYNPLESIIKNTYRIVDVAERNTVARGVARLASVLPDKIKPVRIDMRPTVLTEAEVEKISQGAVTDETATIFRPSPFKPAGRIIEYFDEGKRKYMEVTQNLYDAMTGMNEVSLGLITKILSVPANWLRVGATITPEFMLRNPIRDQFTAFLQTKIGFKPFFDTFKALGDVIGKSEAYNDWIRSGGAYSTFTELSRSNLKNKLKQLRNPSLLRKLNIIRTAQDISQLFEQATRVAVFKAARERGLSAVAAGFQSREATVDFGRHGSQTKDIDAVTAFLRAGIQGLDKSIRSAKNDPGGFTIKALAVITLPTILLYLHNRDDKDYKEIPRWQKDVFWVFKVPGTQTYARIPKPFLYGQLFGSAIERFMEYIESKDVKAFDGIVRSISESAVPVSTEDPISGLLPTGAKPLVENEANWNFFRKQHIVPEARRRLIPSEQYGKYTSETAKAIGKQMGWSPAKIENLITGYFGGSGRYALEITDLLRGRKTQPQRPVEASDIPLVKGFVTRAPESDSESVKQFYQARKDIGEKYATFQKMTKEGRQKEAQVLLKKNPKIRFHNSIEKIAAQMRQIDTNIDLVIAKSLPNETKRKKIKQLEQRKVSLAQKALNVI